MNSTVHGLVTANPSRYVPQTEALAFFTSRRALEPREREIYEKVLAEGPIQGRYVAVDHDQFDHDLTQDELIAQFQRQGRALAAAAGGRALDTCRLEPEQIGALVVNTCTGYLCPGLSSYVAEQLRLPDDVQVFDLVGMGCGAAIPNLRCAAGLSFRVRRRAVLSIAVEVCSATLFFSPDPDQVISNCIFGDGAAAMIIGPGDESLAAAPLFRVIDFETGLFPRYRSDLKYVSRQGKLRNVLSPRVPVIGARTIAQTAGRLLDRNGLTCADAAVWAVHPGGVAVLAAVREKLPVPPCMLEHAYRVFREYGNMSSPSVLFVLKSILAERRPAPGTFGLLLAFGAGFSAHAALVQFL